MGQKDERKPLKGVKSAQLRQRQIGQELERLWGGVTKEPIPEEMLELLRKLDEKERKPPNA